MNTMTPTDKVLKKLMAVCLQELSERLDRDSCNDLSFDKRYWSDDEVRLIRDWYFGRTPPRDDEPDEELNNNVLLVDALFDHVTEELGETDIPSLST